MPTIVAIGAHHDDIELRCGGALAKYVREGWRVVYVVATTTPYYCLTPEEIAAGALLSNREVIELRKQEARRGANILGITEVHFLDFKSQYWYPDGTHQLRYLDGAGTTVEEFRYLNEQIEGREFITTAALCRPAREFLCGFLEEQGADLVLTHFPDDGHWEHYATASLVCACVRQLVQAGKTITLYAWEQGGMGNLTTSFAPTHFVDISQTIDVKCASLLSFPSQFEDHESTMFADRARSCAREYGAMVGMDFAEPFMEFQVPVAPSLTVRLAPTYDVGKAKTGLMPSAAASA